MIGLTVAGFVVETKPAKCYQLWRQCRCPWKSKLKADSSRFERWGCSRRWFMENPSRYGTCSPARQ